MRNRLATIAALLASIPAAARAQIPNGASPSALLPPPPPPVSPPHTPRPPRLEHLRQAHAEGMLGQAVLNDKGATIGHIVNVLIDQNGKTNAVVIEFAGFFGVGDRKVAVAWDALRFAVVKDQIAITVTLDAAKVKALPEYQPDAKSVPVATPQRGKAAP